MIYDSERRKYVKGESFTDPIILKAYEKFYGVREGTLTGDKLFQSNRSREKSCPFQMKPRNTVGHFNPDEKKLAKLKMSVSGDITCYKTPTDGNHWRRFMPTVYENRYRKCAEIHLAEGQRYGELRNKKVRIFAVGLGAGYWTPHGSFFPGGEPTRNNLINGLIVQSYIDLIGNGKKAGKDKYSEIEQVEFSFHGMFRGWNNYLDMEPELKQKLHLHLGEPEKWDDGRICYRIHGKDFLFHTEYDYRKRVEVRERYKHNCAKTGKMEFKWTGWDVVVGAKAKYIMQQISAKRYTKALHVLRTFKLKTRETSVQSVVGDKNLYQFRLKDKFTHNGHPFFKRKNRNKTVDNDRLTVANFAWDGNSYPGNEFWLGARDGSGDPVAACCSTIWNHLNPSTNWKHIHPIRCKVLMNDRQPDGTFYRDLVEIRKINTNPSIQNPLRTRMKAAED